MRFLTFMLVFSSLGFAADKVLVDDTFKATFSDYGRLKDYLSCKPGHQGWYATPDAIVLNSGAVDLGFYPGQRSFIAFSSESMATEPRKGSRPRPYAVGCEPAMKKLVKAIESQSTLELKVHRMLRVSPNALSRAYRNRAGDVQSVSYFQAEHYYETYEFELAGLEFSLDRELDGIEL
jgi:hypothetical protein